ncbi:MAG: COG4705 family protein [Solirubrobacteraceae bacterium]
MRDGALLRRLTVRGALRVPEVTVYFWVIKALSTAFGESTSDYLVHAMDPVIAVVLGFFVFVLALSLQFFVRRYIAWTYWLAVAAVGVFGTMAADVLHVRFGVPYAVSSVIYGIALVAVFVSWYRTEKTLSFHTIDTPRREAFYWAAVIATFAMGTAIGDLTAYTFGLGYFASGLIFAAVIVIPAIGFRRLGWSAILAFWFAYVVTRPLGASFADWMGKPSSVGGLGLGSGTVALALAIIIFCLVAFLAITRRDVQRVHRGAGVADETRLRPLTAPSETIE